MEKQLHENPGYHPFFIQAVRDQVTESHSGPANWAKPLVLEEGMDAQLIQLNNEELQYIEARKLNREECCAVYDVPPPVVHILDNATYSNITEQMRSMYRDTMAPKLRLLESTLEVELRDGSFGAGGPDFGDEVYAEFLMDEVLRGDFEARSAAYTSGVNSGWMQPAEVRRLENLPFVEGSDTLLVNSTLVPVTSAGRTPSAVPVRSLMGRLSRKATLGDVDIAALCHGLGDAATAAVAAAYVASTSVDELKTRLRAMEDTDAGT